MEGIDIPCSVVFVQSHVCLDELGKQRYGIINIGPEDARRALCDRAWLLEEELGVRGDTVHGLCEQELGNVFPQVVYDVWVVQLQTLVPFIRHGRWCSRACSLQCEWNRGWMGVRTRTRVYETAAQAHEWDNILVDELHY